jgi:hypothetical protein
MLFWPSAISIHWRKGGLPFLFGGNLTPQNVRVPILFGGNLTRQNVRVPIPFGGNLS